MIAASITTNVMLGTALLGATAGVIGTFAVLRRRALVSDMLSHAALPGICVAFLITQSRDLLTLSLGALASGLAGIAVMTVLRRWTRTKEDAAIGIVLSTFFGAGVVLLSIIQQQPTGNQAGLHSYLFGETAGITRRDVQLIAGVAVLCLIVVSLLYKEFKLLSFDPDFATAQGWPTLRLDLWMMGTLAIVTIVGLPICGVILMAALVIIPGAAARFWTDRLGRMLVIAALAGASAGGLGTFLASPLPQRLFGTDLLDATKLPPGPLIVLTAAVFFLISLLFAPQRGIVARAVAELRLRVRIAREHLLRALYELSEPQQPQRPYIDRDQLLAQRHWSEWLLNWWLGRLAARGYLELDDHRVRLTAAGFAAAADVTRTHRLWELFLVESAGIASDHVDRDADDVEHMLPAPLIRDLEERLAGAGRLPTAPQRVPGSPHELL
ncbi:MAG: iron chelate uptake ABC transporter family permease subunit [Pirellulales bacterium]